MKPSEMSFEEIKRYLSENERGAVPYLAEMVEELLRKHESAALKRAKERVIRALARVRYYKGMSQ